MKIDTKLPILDLDGKEVRQPPKKAGEEGEVFTFGAAAEGALLTPQQGDEASGQQSFDRFMLAMRLHDAKGEVELSIDEAKLIKDRAAKCYGTLAMGRIWQLLEGAASSSGKKKAA